MFLLTLLQTTPLRDTVVLVERASSSGGSVPLPVLLGAGLTILFALWNGARRVGHVERTVETLTTTVSEIQEQAKKQQEKTEAKLEKIDSGMSAVRESLATLTERSAWMNRVTGRSGGERRKEGV